MEWNLKNMMAEEGCKRKQMAREKIINEGDENSRYFHLIAKGKRRRVKMVLIELLLLFIKISLVLLFLLV
jgi:hypothetical protein